MDPLGPPSQPQGLFVSPLLVSLSIVGCVSMIIAAYHLLLVRFCIRRRRSITTNDSFTIPVQEMRTGVEEDVLKAIPILLYSKVDHDQTECVICLGELEDGDKVRSLPNCGHVFHVPCIDGWLSAHTNCPICRAPIVSSPPPPAAAASTPNSDHHITSVLRESPSINIGRRERNTQNLAQFLEQGDEDGTSTSTGISTNSVNASTAAAAASLQSTRKLLHSLSLVLPVEGKQQSFTKLKRSLSMDQCFVIIDIQAESDDHEKASSSCSSSASSSSPSKCDSSLKGISVENRTYRAISMRQLDRVSSRLLRSFSQIRFGQSAVTSHDTLPC
ncbi:RING-H2 finger protein ATL7 [Ricinus communis]|uniref:RING-H2 finger protein ATL7 n=1 Tax=Ricinus communis TaxID=3988 RepID=UPI00201A7303|nr:RING-H2 finger protein ATL7 [Ricinus communis]